MARKDANPGQKEAAAERRVRALDLRKRGWSYQRIGVELGVSDSTAHDDVRRSLAALAKLEAGEAEDVRLLELERCDRLLAALDARIEAGDPGAVNSAIRVGERRARLLGLDAAPPPSGTEHVRIVGGIDLAVLLGQAPPAAPPMPPTPEAP